MAVEAASPSGTGSGRLTDADYKQLIRRIQGIASSLLPPDATVLVVSRGDEELLNLDGRQAWHFPRDQDGRYAGYHPADSANAIAHLEELRAKGAEYLLFPQTAFWWLEHYPEFKEYLQDRYELRLKQKDCLVFALVPYQPLVQSLTEIAQRLIPPGAVTAIVSLGDDRLGALEGQHVRPFPHISPGDRGSAIAHLEALQTAGVEFLIIPQTAFEWLDGQPELVDHLRERHRLITHQEHVCEIHELCAPPASGEQPTRQQFDAQHPPGPENETRKQSLRQTLLGWLLPNSRDGKDV